MGWNGSSTATNRGGLVTPPTSPLPRNGHKITFVFVSLGVLVFALLIISVSKDKKPAEDQKQRASYAPQERVIPNKGISAVTNHHSDIGQERMSENTTATNKSVSSEVLPELGTLPIPPKPMHASVLPSASDQVISMAVNSSGDIPPIPYTPDMDKAFRESLKKEITIEDTDTPEVVRLKENVIVARKEIKKLLAEGMSVREILEQHRKDVNFAIDMRSYALRQTQELFDKGDVEGARQLTVKMNVALEQAGIEQIDMPMSAEDRKNAKRQQALQRAREQ